MLAYNGFAIALVVTFLYNGNTVHIFGYDTSDESQHFKKYFLQEIANVINNSSRRNMLSFIENWMFNINTVKQRKSTTRSHREEIKQAFYPRANDFPVQRNMKSNYRNRTKPPLGIPRTLLHNKLTSRKAPAILRQEEYTPATKISPVSNTQKHLSRNILTPYSLVSQLKKIISNFPEANITLHSLGHTTEYNDLVLLKIRMKNPEDSKYFRTGIYVDEAPEKKIVLIVHGLSVMGMNVMSDSCLLNPKDVERLMSYYLSHLDKFEIYFIPLINPDGVVANAEYWNKNMSPQSACPGVALDRNFDVAWNGSLLGSCSQGYPGPAPFTEAETRAIRDLFHHYSHKIIAYIHVHHGTYKPNFFKGDAVLYPNGYTEINNDDDKYIDLRAEIDEAMRNASFRVYSVAVETLYNWYGKVTGTSVDYAATVYGIPFALEFVMQSYENNIQDNETKEQMTYHALNEIWRRVIDVVFTNIHRSQQPIDNNL